MKFDAAFVSSFASVGTLPVDGKPEVALIGRSNVGKSSLLNALADRKQLAKTSGTPGKTRTLNYYLVNGAFYLVDMPGYGYARHAKSERVEWARVAERYFIERKELTDVGLLIDARHPRMESDEAAIQWFRDHEISLFIVLTKCDKAKQRDIAGHVRAIGESDSISKIFTTSSVEGRGMADLRRFIAQSAAGSNSRAPRVFQQPAEV